MFPLFKQEEVGLPKEMKVKPVSESISGFSGT